MSTNPDFDYRTQFSRSRDVMGGEVVLKGTRIPLTLILGSLADGDTPEVLMRSFPTMTQEHMCAVIAFPAACAREDFAFIELSAA